MTVDTIQMNHNLPGLESVLSLLLEILLTSEGAVATKWQKD